MNYYRQYRPGSSSGRFPPVVLNLIIINAIMFFVKMFAMNTRQIDLDILLGLHHPYSYDFSWYQYITGLFMHADMGHLLFNMLGLWMFGHMLENIWNTRKFIAFYLICGIGSSLIYQIFQTYQAYQLYQSFGDVWMLMKEYPPGGYLIGASGAVYGLMMGTALTFPNTEMYMFGFMGMPIKLKWIAVLYGGGELLRAWQANPHDNVAHFAHIGGMIFGFILIKLFKQDRGSFY
ncbi:MAG: rhomboid family intramembrane serine protease [Bacteroidia bacterium]